MDLSVRRVVGKMIPARYRDRVRQWLGKPDSAPSPSAGRYVLEIDLVSGAVCWFATNGSPAVRLPVEVE